MSNKHKISPKIINICICFICLIWLLLFIPTTKVIKLHLFDVFWLSTKWRERDREREMWTEKESILAKRRALGFTPATSLSLGSHFNETRKQRPTHTHIVSCILTEMRAKQTTEGGDAEWCVCWPWGASGVQTLTWLHPRSGHKGEAFTKTNRTKAQKRCPSVWWPTLGNIQAGKNVYFHVAFKLQWHLGCRQKQVLSVTCVYLLANKKRVITRKKTCPAAFLSSTPCLQSERSKPVCGKTALTFTVSSKKKYYLCLFIHIPGEGDSIVGDFFNVADCIKALLVISCEETGSIFRLHSIHSNRWVSEIPSSA